MGRAGEERILVHERTTLVMENRRDLAERVGWVSQEDGAGAGYDIASFTPEGRERFIEVKTTSAVLHYPQRAGGLPGALLPVVPDAPVGLLPRAEGVRTFRSP